MGDMDIDSWKKFLLEAEINEKDVELYAELFAKERVRIFSLSWVDYRFYKRLGIPYIGDILRIQEYVRQRDREIAKSPSFKQEVDSLIRETEEFCDKIECHLSQVVKGSK